MAPKKDKQEQNREGPQQPALDMQAPVGEPEEAKELRQSVAALRDALQRETQRADAAEKERDTAAALVEKQKIDISGHVGTIGQQAEQIHSLQTDLERLTAPQAPVAGWASERAKELALAVPEPDRLLLLGDLLALLAPHVGETGANETATDALGRKLNNIEEMRSVGKEMLDRFILMEKQERSLHERVAALQAALVARRAPDATAEAEFSRVREALRGPALVFGLSGNVDWAAVAEQLAKEWRGLRTFFSEKPMVALAVKDESTPALADRYTLLLLQWDGKKLAPSTLEERMPWGDISPLLRQALASRLTPPQFRG